MKIGKSLPTLKRSFINGGYNPIHTGKTLKRMKDGMIMGLLANWLTVENRNMMNLFRLKEVGRISELER